MLAERLDSARVLLVEIEALLGTALTEAVTLGSACGGILDALHDKTEAFVDLLAVRE